MYFFLLIYRKRKFCAEPMRERLTFHFELRTQSGNFRFFFFFSFFLFFQIKARSRLVTKSNTVPLKIQDFESRNYLGRIDVYQVKGVYI